MNDTPDNMLSAVCCECAYCGHKLTRRTRHSNSTYEKPVWQCMNATKHGIKNCPNCKAIDEVILEGAFVEAFGLLAGNFEDVLEIVLAAVESSLTNDEDIRRRQQLDKDISSLELHLLALFSASTLRPA